MKISGIIAVLLAAIVIGAAIYAHFYAPCVIYTVAQAPIRCLPGGG